MSSPESEPRRSEDKTAHTVTLSDFYISQYEVTQVERILSCSPTVTMTIAAERPARPSPLRFHRSMPRGMLPH